MFRFKKKRKMRRNVFLERRERRARNRIFRILFIILGMLLIYFILSSPLLKIKKINVSGNNSIPLEKIEGEIKLVLEENIWFLIPGDNIIFASAKNGEEKIKEKFSEAREVKIRKNWLDIKNPGEFKLEVEILEKEKNVIWCQECPFDENNNNTCFYLDEEGIAFSAAEKELGKIKEIIVFEKPRRKVFNKNEELLAENKSDKEFQEWKIDCGECGMIIASKKKK